MTGGGADRLRITCPACGAVASAPAAVAGRSVQCGRCKHLFRAPAAGALPPAAPAGEPAPAPTIADDSAPTAGAAPVRAADTDWSPGDVVLGLYEVASVLGQGGMGRVYRVRHRGWGVDLAVKAPLRKALEAAGGVEVFEREAETWVGLGLHPHVVSCYYVRRIDGVPRVFAEYVDGGSLQEAIRGRRLTSAAAALDVAIQFAWGLDYAHEQGLVHRDVKPANVLLTSGGVAKVTDFGLAGARVAAAPVSSTGEQTTMAPGGGGGTPAYMSPEQRAGHPLTRRTDVWSWAASVLEAFLGRREWELGPAAGLALERCLGSPREWALPLPPAVADLLGRCLHQDVDQRPRTMAEVAGELIGAHGALTGRPYARPRPTGGRDTADSLNNRAVSLLDLGRSGVDALWAQALRADPQHLEASYNQALHAWTHGRIGDEELGTRVQAAHDANARAARASELLAQARQALAGAELAATRSVKLDGAFAVAVTPGLRRVVSIVRGASDVRVLGSDLQSPRSIALVDLKPRTLAVADDGRRLLVGGEGGPPQLWDLEGSHALRTLARYPGLTNTVAVSADGRRAVTAGSDRVVRVFDLESGSLLQALEGHADAITCLALDASARIAATGGLDGSVHVWDLGEGSHLHALEAHRGRVSAVAVSRDGAVVLSGGEDRALRQWDVAQGALVRALLGPAAAVTGLLCSEDGREAVAGSLDRSLRIWELGTGRLRGLFRPGAPIAAMAGTTEAVWAATGTGLRELRPESPNWQPPYAVARPLSALEVESRHATFLSRASAARQAITQGELARAVTLAREARAVPGHERSQEALSLWDEVTAQVPRGRLLAAWESGKLEGHRDPVVSVAVSPDGARAASGDLAGGVRFWDLRGLTPVEAVEGHPACVSAVALVADGRVGLSASWDRTVKVWDVATRRAVRVLEGHGDYVNGMALSPSGRTVVTASADQTLRLWDLASGRALGVLEGHEAAVSGCAFGPDGRFVVSGSWDGGVRLWDVEARASAGVLEGHEEGVAAVAVSPDGRQALSGGIDGTLRSWDLRQRRAQRAWRGHEAEVTTVAFLPDGRHAVSAARDKTVRVWDLESGAAVRSLPHTGAVLSAAALPSGNGLVCGGTDLALTLWRLDWEADAPPPRETVLRLQQQTVRPAAGSAWEEIQHAPRAGAREAAALAARTARRRLPAGRTLALAGVLLVAVAGIFAVLRPKRVVLGLSEHQAKLARSEVAGEVVPLKPYGDCSDGGYEDYLLRSREPVVAEDTLACLLVHQQAGLADVYLRELVIDGTERTLIERRRRNATSFLVALGDPAVPTVCRTLGSRDVNVRSVIAGALAGLGTGAAVDCVRTSVADPDPEIRAGAAGALRLLLAREVMEAPAAWPMAVALAADPDPGVRRASVPLLGMFDFDHSQPALAVLEKDGDPDVAGAARQHRYALRQFKNLNPDLPY